MKSTVENVCNLLARSRLLPAQDVRAARQRWLKEAKDSADVAQFARWLVTASTATGAYR